MAAMPSPATPEITSRSNPRVAAVAGLRDRRERERQGLTVVDGSREVRRALDSGADVVEAFVCGPLLAGPDARAALDALERRGTRSPRSARASSRSSPSATGRRGCSRSSGSRTCRSSGWRCPRIRSSRSSRASRSPATSGRSCARPTAPGRTRWSPPRRGPTCSTRTPSGRAPARSSASRSRPRRPRTRSRGRGQPASGSWPPASMPTVRTREADLTGPIAIVLGAEADGLTATWDAPDIEAVADPDARHRRQPERLGRRGAVALRGPAATRPSRGPGRLTRWTATTS